MLGHTYGWRARIGIILPSICLTEEYEYPRMVPEGVTVHFTRMAFENVTQENYVRMLDDVPRSAKLLSHARVHATAFACTSGSLFGGLGYDQKIIEIMKEHMNCPCTTTSTAVVEALKAIGIKKLSVGTPYPDWVNRLELKFLEDSGFQIVNIRGILQDVKELFGINPENPSQELSFLTNAIPPQRVYEFAASKINKHDCDGIFLSCMALPTLGIINLLEKDLGKPVITSSQATLWKLLKMAGVDTKVCMEQFGGLFSR